MKSILVICLILISAQSKATFEDVLETTIDNNSKVVGSQILEDNITDEGMDLLLKTLELQSQITGSVDAQEIICDEQTDPTDPNKPKKKKKVSKSKTVTYEGFELVFLAQASNYQVPDINAFDTSTNVVPTPEVIQLYNQMHNSATEAEMWQHFDNFVVANNIKNLPVAEQVKFAAMLESMLPYSDGRASFLTEYNQGAVSTFTQFTTDDPEYGGVCGDVHGAHNELVNRINPELEAYTMSYAVDGAQHVISYVVDPNDPERMLMTNYSQVAERGSDGVATTVPVNTSMDDIGERVRFFQYKDGEQSHVATFRNDVGSLLYELSVSPVDRTDTPNDSRYDVQQIKMSWGKVVNKYKTIEKANGEIKEKNKSYRINNDLVLFRAKTTTGVEMIGVMQRRQKLNNMNANGELIDPSKMGSSGFISTSVSTNDYSRTTPMVGGANWYDENRYYRVYFVTGKKYVKRIVEKNGFYLDGFFSHQLEASAIASTGPSNPRDLSAGNSFAMQSGDGDYATQVGLKANYNLNKTNTLKMKTSLTSHIGLNDERAIYSFTTDYPQNLKMTPNAFNANAALQTDLGSGRMINQVDYVGTQMGGKLRYRFDYLGNKGGNLFVDISTPTGGISANKVNVLPQNYTVIGVGGSTPDLLKKQPKVDMRLNGRLEVMPTMPSPVIFQTGINLRFGS